MSLLASEHLAPCSASRLATALQLDGAPQVEAERIVQAYGSILQTSDPSSLSSAQWHLASRVLLPRGWHMAALAITTSHPIQKDH